MTTFPKAVSDGLKNFFTTNGRMSRSAYWWFALFYILVIGAIYLLVVIINGNTPDSATFLNFLCDISFYYILIVPGIRRLHDINKSGKNALWILLPMIGWGILIYLYCQPSETEENYY